MKTILLATLFLISGNVFSQKETAQLDIKTSAICGMCEDRIEEKMKFSKGVKSADLDLKTKVLHLTYDPAKVSAIELRVRVTKIGYHADDMKRDEKTYNKLPKCCKEGSSCDSDDHKGHNH
jgi:mercuric ion binding protein